MHQSFCSHFKVNQDSDILSVEGCPAGIPLTKVELFAALKRFFESYSADATTALSTSHIDIVEGVSSDQTTGQTLRFRLENMPGEGDHYVRHAIAFVMAGVVGQNILGSNVRMRGALVQVGEHIVDRSDWSWAEVDNNKLFSPNAKAAEFWAHFLGQVSEAKQSVGAVIELQASGVPEGWSGNLGAPLDGELARALMSIMGAKGVEVGAGFALAALTGNLSQDKQEESADGTVRFKTNKAGGIVGGRSTGQDIVARVAIEPTSLTANDNVNPCYGISAVPLGEALLACVLAGSKLQKNSGGDLAAAS